MTIEEHNQLTAQVRKEIHAVFRRYGEESDLSVYTSLGILRIIESDLIEMLQSANGFPSE